jgi:hypothetical protein
MPKTQSGNRHGVIRYCTSSQNDVLKIYRSIIERYREWRHVSEGKSKMVEGQATNTGMMSV